MSARVGRRKSAWRLWRRPARADLAVQSVSGLSHFERLLADLESSWRLCGFRSAELEQRYQVESRLRRSRSRVILFSIALTVFGLAPLYGPTLLATPPAIAPLFRAIEFLGIVPLSVLGLWFNLRWPRQRWVSGYTLLASPTIVGLLITMRYVGLPHGFAIPFETVAIAIIINTSLSGLRTSQTLAMLALSAATLLGMEWLAFGIGPHFWWAVMAALVTFSFGLAGEVSMDIGSRRAWITRQLAELSGMRDGLTGLPNRSWFERDAARMLDQARRERQPVAALVFDIDHFKQLNDSLGHAAGDACLRRIGALLIERFGGRPLDLRARIGGEEFVLLLYGTDLAGAQQTAEQLVGGVRALALEHPLAELGVVTISVGVCARVPGDDEDIWGLVSCADRCLYAAKRGGRNQWRS